MYIETQTRGLNMIVKITRTRTKAKIGRDFWIYNSDAPMKGNSLFKIGGYASLSSLKSYIKRVYEDVEFFVTW